MLHHCNRHANPLLASTIATLRACYYAFIALSAIAIHATPLHYCMPPMIPPNMPHFHAEFHPLHTVIVEMSESHFELHSIVSIALKHSALTSPAHSPIPVCTIAPSIVTCKTTVLHLEKHHSLKLYNVYQLVLSPKKHTFIDVISARCTPRFAFPSRAPNCSETHFVGPVCLICQSMRGFLSVLTCCYVAEVARMRY